MIRIQMVDEEPDAQEFLQSFSKFFEPAKEAPFRDAESAGYFREVLGVEPDDDWYSIPDPEETDRAGEEDCRLAFGNLLYVHKIALLLIRNSREGSDTPFQLAKCLEKKAWLYMASLPFDILICMRRYSSGVELLRNVDYLVSGYRYRGREIEVTVTDRITHYRKVEPHAKVGAGYGLCMGKDGRYYTGSWKFESAVRFYWLNDIPDTLNHLAAGRKNRECLCLMGEPKVYSLLEYAKLVLRILFRQSRMGAAAIVPGSEKESRCLHSVLSSEFGMEESEFPDIKEFKVINYLYSYPDPVSRTLPIFLVDRCADGSWSLGQDVTFKNPEFDEILAQVVCGLRSPALERYILVVDRNIELDGPEDFENTLCGFLLKPNSMEVYGKDMALNRFEDALREAAASENFEVRNVWKD